VEKLSEKIIELVGGLAAIAQKETPTGEPQRRKKIEHHRRGREGYRKKEKSPA